MGGMEDSALLALTANRYKCSQCSAEEYPEEQLQCSECDEPVRASIFDTDLKVKKVKAADSDFPTLAITPTLKFEDLRVPEEDIEPYDFQNKVFPVKSLDQQAKEYQVTNPYGQITDHAEDTFEDEAVDEFVE
jgi:hypothetical protein